ncbi:MAG: hypothetical protein IKE16_09090 [Solobacterium sp.]|nr:hypothetical protein [Solobacterium sp.]MBR2768624.1 hypothetical protein [Solobacterium sp.]MBR2794787.1 hypothetical protein [Solobacterium sp.]
MKDLTPHKHYINEVIENAADELIDSNIIHGLKAEAVNTFDSFHAMIWINTLALAIIAGVFLKRNS